MMIVTILLLVFMGLILASMGIFTFQSKKPVYFKWVNFPQLKPDEVSDVKRYNRAVGKLLIAIGIFMALIGVVSFWIEQNSASVVVLILPTIFLAMATLYGFFHVTCKYKR